MRTVSTGWIENQEQDITSKAYLEISMLLTDESLASTGSISDNGHIAMSDVDKAQDDTFYEVEPYVTLEANLWKLDGSRNIAPSGSPYGYNGFVSDDASDASGEFTTDPIITRTFPSLITSEIEGITITWGGAYGEYASEFTVTVYDGVTQLDQAVVTGNEDVISVVELAISDYDKITVEINKWNTPYHRARMDKLFLGIRLVYTNDDIKRYISKHRCDPYSFYLPSGKINFSIDNSNGQFDPTDSGSYFKYLSENQKVSVRVGYKIDGLMEWINNGVFYLSDWSNLTSADKANFVAEDLLTGWTETYIKGTYSTSPTKTLTELAEEVFTDMGLTSAYYDIDSRLDGISSPVNNIVLPIAKHSECLQLIAASAACALFVDKDGIVRIKATTITGSDDPEDYEITRDVQFVNSGLDYAMSKKTLVMPTYIILRRRGSTTDVLVQEIKLTGSAGRIYVLL